MDIINNYLWFSYLPPKNIPKWLQDIFLDQKPDYDYNIESLNLLVDDTFNSLFSTIRNEKLIVPLSGGWDSRLILAAALDRFNTKQIETVTFGVPGQLDFDIGVSLSKKLHIKNNAIDLSNVKLELKKLIDSVVKTPFTYVPDSYYNQLIFEHLTCNDKIMVSGFLGDLFNGGHYYKKDVGYTNVNEHFIKKEKRCSILQLHEPNFSPNVKYYNNDNISYDNKYKLLFLGIHGIGCTMPINLMGYRWNDWSGSVKNVEGKSIITPFISYKWAKYWLNAPNTIRQNQLFFVRSMKKKYHKIFTYRSKYDYSIKNNKNKFNKYTYKSIKNSIKYKLYNRAPISAFTVSEYSNYLDFNEIIRTRHDYKQLLLICIQYLEDNQVVPWLNLDEILSYHMERKKNLSTELLTLMGLSLNLMKNNEKN